MDPVTSQLRPASDTEMSEVEVEAEVEVEDNSLSAARELVRAEVIDSFFLCGPE